MQATRRRRPLVPFVAALAFAAIAVVAPALVALATAGPAQAATETAQLLAPDGSVEDYYGFAVAVSGDTAVIGAHRDESWRGSAYVFVRAGGVWAFQQKLTPADAVSFKEFGYSVAIDGDTVLVGANCDDEWQLDRGAVYVFTRTAGVWTQQQKLISSDGAGGDQFGTAVALQGDTAMVGAQIRTVAGKAGQGVAYAFTRSGGVWTEQQVLTASDGAAQDYFGSAIALDGDTAVIGQQQRYEGAVRVPTPAYVFARSGGTWTQQAKLTAADGAATDMFGWSVALSGDVALIGAYQHDVGGNGYQGAAYAFVRSGTTWVQQAELNASDGAPGDLFGYAVALDGDTAVVGAKDDTVDYQQQGSAYVFTRSGTTWNQQVQLVASDAGMVERFGSNTGVAVEGDTVLVGAPEHRDGGVMKGAAYVFQVGDPPVTTAAATPLPNARGWNKAPVTVTLSATDPDSTVAATEYRLMGAADWTAYAAPFPVSALGVSTYEFRSVDIEGNLEAPKKVTVRIDTTRPVTKALARASVVRYRTAYLRLRVNDTVAPKATVTVKIYRSGVLKKTLRLGLRATNKDLRYGFTCKLARGTYTWKAYATDLAGNTQRRVGYNRLVVR
jgi:hypothetical protein